jgi:hypothetical protein
MTDRTPVFHLDTLNLNFAIIEKVFYWPPNTETLRVNPLEQNHPDKVLNSGNEQQRNHMDQNLNLEIKWKQCSVCDQKFRTDQGLSLHLTKICQRTCQECKKIFSTKELMLAHARVKHAKELKEKKCWTKCRACDQKIQIGRNFVQHMTICNGNKLMKNPEIEMFNQAGPDNANPPNCTTNYEYKMQLINDDGIGSDDLVKTNILIKEAQKDQMFVSVEKYLPETYSDHKFFEEILETMEIEIKEEFVVDPLV